jgi:hypothetical protein
MYRQHLPTTRRFCHSLLILVGWTLFLTGWWQVITVPAATAGLNTLLQVMLIALAGFPLLTYGWIRHNLSLENLRRGVRRQTVDTKQRRQRDWNGLLMIMNMTEVRFSPWLRVDREGQLKTISGYSCTNEETGGKAA